MVYKTRQTALLTYEKLRSDTLCIRTAYLGEVASIVKILTGRKLFDDSRDSDFI